MILSITSFINKIDVFEIVRDLILLYGLFMCFWLIKNVNDFTIKEYNDAIIKGKIAKKGDKFNLYCKTVIGSIGILLLPTFAGFLDINAFMVMCSFIILYSYIKHFPN